MPFFFFRNEVDDINFSCKLQCQQCTALTSSGVRCRKRTCKSLPVCHIHLQNKFNLKIKPSRLEGVDGYGLFTTKPFLRGQRVCFYTGERLRGEEIDMRYGGDDVTAPYALELRDGIFIDSACARGIGSWINHSRDPNVEMVQIRDRVVIRTLRDLDVDEELLISYGEDYQLENENYRHYTKPYHRMLGF